MPLQQHIKDAIKNHKTDEAINLRGCLWGYLHEIEELITLINSNNKIVAVSLCRNDLDSPAIQLLVKLQNVHTLLISRVYNLDDAAAIALVRNQQFRVLDLSGNLRLTDEAGKIFLLDATQISLELQYTAISASLQAKIQARIDDNSANYLDKIFSDEENAKKFLENEASISHAPRFS